jgi:hypothetical protein
VAFSDSGNEVLLPLGKLLEPLQRLLGGQLGAVRAFGRKALDPLLPFRHGSPPKGDSRLTGHCSTPERINPRLAESVAAAARIARIDRRVAAVMEKWEF